IVPMLQCGFVRSNFSFAIAKSYVAVGTFFVAHALLSCPGNCKQKHRAGQGIGGRGLRRLVRDK
ncbi:MAG: hypothetical protein AAFQ51_16445, partial [Pseudomonadota bacterium]